MTNQTPESVIAEVIEYYADTIGSHYDGCYKHHAVCLAVKLRDMLREPGVPDAAAGVAPQAESVERANLIGRLTGSVNPLSVTCGECGSRPGRRCYGNGEMRRPHPSRETKAERELMIEAAEALAAPVQPSSTVNEAALIREAKAEALEEFAGQMATGFNPQTLNAERRAIKREARARAAEYREGSET